MEFTAAAAAVNVFKCLRLFIVTSYFLIACIPKTPACHELTVDYNKHTYITQETENTVSLGYSGE